LGAGLKEILQYLGAHIRALGFKGSGQTFRRVEDNYVFVINIQGSRSGEGFFVNLGLVERGLMLAGSHATGLIHDPRTAETPITIMDKNIRIELT
jgi:hypothetical protein